MSHEAVIHHLHIRAKSYRESANIARAAGDDALAELLDDDADGCIFAQRALSSDVADRQVSDAPPAAVSDTEPIGSMPATYIPFEDDELDDDMMQFVTADARRDGYERGYDAGSAAGEIIALTLGWRARRRRRRELDELSFVDASSLLGPLYDELAQQTEDAS